jgi:hypothetical protein
MRNKEHGLYWSGAVVHFRLAAKLGCQVVSSSGSISHMGNFAKHLNPLPAFEK